jgi:hypothetical protein
MKPDRLEREPRRQLDRRPELRVVEDLAVGSEAAAVTRLLVLDAEQERREERDEEVERPEHDPDDRDVRPSKPQAPSRSVERRRAHFAHLEARRCSGM